VILVDSSRVCWSVGVIERYSDTSISAEEGGEEFQEGRQRRDRKEVLHNRERRWLDQKMISGARVPAGRLTKTTFLRS
jgi:hypothetical protein